MSARIHPEHHAIYYIYYTLENKPFHTTEEPFLVPKESFWCEDNINFLLRIFNI